MAKKKTARRKTTRRSSRSEAAEDRSSLDENPQVQEAADALRAAKEQLAKAEEMYQQTRAAAAAKVDQLSKTTLGEVVDGALEIVRKHPGPSLLAALVAGFMIDRWLRRD